MDVDAELELEKSIEEEMLQDAENHGDQSLNISLSYIVYTRCCLHSYFIVVYCYYIHLVVFVSIVTIIVNHLHFTHVHTFLFLSYVMDVYIFGFNNRL